MAGLRHLWEYIFGPTLYTVYRDNGLRSVYVPNGFEKYGGQIISSFLLLWNVGLYSCPLIATVIYKKGYIGLESLALVTKVLIGIGVILSSSYCIRGLGRKNNPAYVNFYEVLLAAKKSLNKDTKRALAKYDFEFSEWPVEFKWNDVSRNNVQNSFLTENLAENNSLYNRIKTISCQFPSYIAAKTFGIKLMYPGSIRTLQYFMFSVILEGREKLILDFQGERFKLRTKDENDIDSIFFDKRGQSSNGDTLIICCEGNAGFYELGIVTTPLALKYSVLGWNHPGFGGSTGSPFPSQEQNAIECVIQFAIEKLKFSPENIVLFGWSIGGYTASWGAMNYPEIKGIILDATFDDVLYLALPRMPQSWGPLVKQTIRNYINLNVFEVLKKYNGPVIFIRRTADEIICTEAGNLSTNRGNHLVKKFLKYRYPNIVDERRESLLNEWLASDSNEQIAIWNHHGVNKEECSALLYSYTVDNSEQYPMGIGVNFTEDLKNQMTLYLVEAHLKNFPATHCPPLTINLFKIPQSLSAESSFVKI